MDQQLAQEILRQANAQGEARQDQLQRDVQARQEQLQQQVLGELDVMLRQLHDVQIQQAAVQAAAGINGGAPLLAEDALRPHVEEMV